MPGAVRLFYESLHPGWELMLAQECEQQRVGEVAERIREIHLAYGDMAFPLLVCAQLGNDGMGCGRCVLSALPVLAFGEEGAPRVR